MCGHVFVCRLAFSLDERSFSSLTSGIFSDHEQVLYFCCLIQEPPATGGHGALEVRLMQWRKRIFGVI